jgi:hypothetical protein
MLTKWGEETTVQVVKVYRNHDWLWTVCSVQCRHKLVKEAAPFKIVEWICTCGFFFNWYSGGLSPTVSTQHCSHQWPIVPAPGGDDGEIGGMIGRGNLCLVSLLVSFLLAFTPISYMHSSSLPFVLLPCPSHPLCLGHSNYTWWWVQVMKLLTMQFSPTSYHFITLRLKYSLQHCSSLNVRDQVSHPYRTTGKIIVWYILICMFLDSRREDKNFWTEW